MKSILFDVDTGIDDALAMAYALNSPELNVLGFTTCFGNVPVEEATRNTLAILEKVGKMVPVYEGAASTFARGMSQHWAKHIHGEDGLGNVLDELPTAQAEKGFAPDFIVEQVKRYPQEITIIAVGPLTNLALAIKGSPEIIPLVKEVIIMGGAVKVPGNITIHGEANIVADPEAAAYVLSSGLQITLVGLDVTMQTLLPQSALNKWRENGQETGQFFANMTDFYMEAYEEFSPGIGGCALHDPLAVGVAIDAGFVETERLHVEVITEGEEVGKTIGSSHKEPKINVCTQVLADQFLAHFLSRII